MDKLRLIDQPSYLRENVDVRARGASKTFDTMELALFLAWVGYRGIWFSAGKDQLDQPKQYLKYIIDHSKLLQHDIDILLKESVSFKNGGRLRLRNLTELNARSSRADFIVYDEEAQADEDAYNAAVSILAGTSLGLVFHISTPVKASVFENNYDRMRLRELKHKYKFVYTRKWYEAGFLAKRSEWYEEEKRIKPGWYFRQEHECSFELPSGAILQNIQYGPYEEWLMNKIKNQPLCSGLDWNPVAGHWIVSGKWTDDMTGFVILGEYPIGNGYTIQMTKQQYQAIRNVYILDKRLVIESGGLNEAYCLWFEKQRETEGALNQRVSYEEWDSSGINKLNTVEFIITHGITIYCDKRRFPTLAKQIEELHWDPNATEPRIAKDPADSPHALDAFLHAISELNRDDHEVVVERFY